MKTTIWTAPTNLPSQEVQISLSDMDVPSWKHDLEADLFLIRELTTSMELVGPDDDAKLQHLKGIIAGSSRAAQSAEPQGHNLHGLRDTANYLYANLAPALLQSNGFIRARTVLTHPRPRLKRAMISSRPHAVFARSRRRI